MTTTSDSPDDLSARTAANAERLRELAADVSRMAGKLAATEDRMADEREQTARDVPARAPELLGHARHAREFAEHERREQERWRKVAEE